MAIAVTSIGTSAGAAPRTITVGVGGVPSGSLIVCGAVERATGTTPGAISDSKSNSYSYIISAAINGGNGPGGMAYAKNTTALVSGDTITQASIAGADAALTAIYATGVTTTTPVDTAVTASATGTGTTPSVTSGTPAQVNELFIGIVASQGIASFTQDTGHGWALPPNQVGSGSGASNRSISGGNQVNAGTGTKIFAPTLGTSADWAAFVAGFKPGNLTYSLTATAGSFALTGIAATLCHGYKVAATAGVYAITGIAATLKSVRHIVAVAGSYAITGSNTIIGKAYKVVATAGAYVLTGFLVTNKYTRILTAAAGTFAVTGKAATLNSIRHIVATVGAYALTGKAATLNSGRHMVASAGSYVLSGIALIEAYFPAAAPYIRKSVAVLQKLRTTDPTLDQ